MLIITYFYFFVNFFGVFGVSCGDPKETLIVVAFARDY